MLTITHKATMRILLDKFNVAGIFTVKITHRKDHNIISYSHHID